MPQLLDSRLVQAGIWSYQGRGSFRVYVVLAGTLVYSDKVVHSMEHPTGVGIARGVCF